MSTYGAFVDYYGNIQLKQIKNENNYIIYAAQVKSNLLSGYRYIFAIVYSSVVVADITYLNDIDWINLQTRETEELYNVPVYNFILDERRKKLLDDKLLVSNRTAEKTEYILQTLPIKVTILHDMKKNNYLQCPNELKLYQALETYRCIVDML